MSAPTNSYNRPNFPHVCGRARLWQKPCPAGPNPDGTCGGTTFCQPQKKGDRWGCRRPAALGGPCSEGPLPEGTCAHTRPACRPEPSLRKRRQRLTTAAALLVIGVLIAFGAGGDVGFGDSLDTRNPGPLRAAHTGIIAEKGCTSCHASHDEDVAGFMLATVTNSAPDKAGANKCLDCHVFDTVNTPHKASTCGSCHTAHKGRDMPVSEMTDAQCNACHKVKMTNFSRGHPQFDENYPHDSRTAVAFDHTKHLDTYFKDGRYAKNAPEGRCISCHDVSQALNNVPVRPFDQVCASCHAAQIPRRDLVLFEMPELDSNPLDVQDLTDVCRMSPEKTEKGEEFYSVSAETPNALTAVLFELDGDDAKAYTPAMGKLLSQLIEEGPAAFAAAIKEWEGDPARLLSGLSPEIARQAACAWAFNLEYEGPELPAHGGWYADELSLRYKAGSHGDPVMKAWLSFIAGLEEDDLTETILSKDGPGACLSCHAVSETDTLAVEWASVTRTAAKNFSYDHGPHLDLLGPGSQCETCHALNKTVDYGANFQGYDPTDYTSGFNPMTSGNCIDCHGDTKLASGCLTCHEYHGENGFKSRQMLRVEDENSEQGKE